MRQRTKGSNVRWRLGFFAVLTMATGYLWINTHIAIIQPAGHRPTFNVFWLPNHQGGKPSGPDFTVQF